MVALKYKEEGNQPLAHLEHKSLGEFFQFRNMKNLLVMIEKADYYDENPLNYECEDVSRMPCCILKDVMHGEEETKCVHVVGHIHDMNLLGLLRLPLNFNLLDVLMAS
jgi:hypothetical protein